MPDNPDNAMNGRHVTTCLVIPARHGSTRFPGKPLAMIDGIPMVIRVWSQAIQAKSVDHVLVATDHEAIKSVVETAGGQVVMTPSDLPSGTDRAAFATADIDADFIINLQGDEPLINPDYIDLAVQALCNDNRADMATLACPLHHRADVWNQNIVKVLVNRTGHAIYFSRAPIPFPTADTDWNRYLRHAGLYVYRKQYLQAFVAMKPSWSEQVEHLEQLRVLDNGGVIHVQTVDCVDPGVDIPDDIAIIESLILERRLQQE